MNKKSTTPFLDFIRNNKYEHEATKEKLQTIMQKRGWKHTSATPGCRWMWEKLLPDGRTVLVDLETAVRFEEDICGEYYESD